MYQKKRNVLVFSAIAILLSNIMCAVVAYNWCAMEYAIRYQYASAPTYVALFTGVPFLAGIVICVGAALYYYKKSKK